ncbi:hypothetical protein MKW94_015899 [Papaver nudicaule]|uniref:RING-type E3 ubiquitin transferase n=1 Tax=Papaver nudicaule TaxID=74823 RepID=A0AA41V1I3_PAPNU|nr:hypothetical protein [Papaver nudicaule]
MAANPESEANFLEQLISSRNKDISFFLPFLFGLSSRMIVIEGVGRGFDEFMRQMSEKQGLAPATKASIDAMPKCSICLDGFEIGAEAREIPCKHRYHSNCIEKWLGIHGNYPVCQFTCLLMKKTMVPRGTIAVVLVLVGMKRVGKEVVVVVVRFGLLFL